MIAPEQFAERLRKCRAMATELRVLFEELESEAQELDYGHWAEKLYDLAHDQNEIESFLDDCNLRD